MFVKYGVLQGYYRQGVALQCLGRHGDALAAFSSGLAQEPKSTQLLAGLIEASIKSPLRGNLLPYIFILISIVKRYQRFLSTIYYFQDLFLLAIFSFLFCSLLLFFGAIVTYNLVSCSFATYIIQVWIPGHFYKLYYSLFLATAVLWMTHNPHGPEVKWVRGPKTITRLSILMHRWADFFHVRWPTECKAYVTNVKFTFIWLS